MTATARPSAPQRGLPLAMAVAPPFPLVGAHFAAGFAWALLGAAGIVALAPELARGTILDPRIAGLTHLFTLGWLTTVINGVLYQIFPAMLGISAQSLRVARWSLGLHTLGLACLATGLAGSVPQLQAAGWGLLFVAVFGTAWNLLPQRRRAPRNRQLGLYVSYAHMAFGLAMVIGGARIGDALGWWTTPRLSLISAHFHLAAGGFATMILLGVGSRMTPMFLGSETTGEPAWFEIWLRRALALGTVVYAAGAIASSAPVAWAGALVMGIAVCGALWRTAGWFRHRSAPRLDPSTALLLGAHLWLGSGLLLGIDVLWRGPRNPGVMTSYAVMILLGWLGSSIVAVSYRVLPNLAWHHRFGAKPRSPGTPSPAQMVVPPLAWVAGAAYSAGVLAIVGGLHRGNPALVQTGGVMIGAGIVATISHHLRLMLVGRAAAAPGA